MTDTEDSTSVRRDAGEVLIVTGMSGAGRSTAADALEDLGWYVVDNLPPQMLRPLLELTELAGGALPRVAVVVDVRGRDLFVELPEVTRALRHGRPVRVMFLDASDEVLVRRFEAVRRPHPLQGEGTVLDGIHLERRILAPVRESADVIDRHLRLQHPSARDAGHRDVLGRRRGAAHRHDHELRIQVRAAARRRSGRRHAIPAESVLERRSARPHRRRRRRPRFRPGPAGRGGIPGLATPPPSSPFSTATSARTRAIRWSRSAAPAESTDPS